MFSLVQTAYKPEGSGWVRANRGNLFLRSVPVEISILCNVPRMGNMKSSQRRLNETIFFFHIDHAYFQSILAHIERIEFGFVYCFNVDNFLRACIFLSLLCLMVDDVILFTNMWPDGGDFGIFFRKCQNLHPLTTPQLRLDINEYRSLGLNLSWKR